MGRSAGATALTGLTRRGLGSEACAIPFRRREVRHRALALQLRTHGCVGKLRQQLKQVLPHVHSKPLATLQHRQQRRHLWLSFLAPNLKPVLAPERNTPHRVLRPVVVDLHHPVSGFSITYQAIPLLERVRSRFAQRTLRQYLRSRFVNQFLNPLEQRRTLRCPQRLPLRGGKISLARPLLHLVKRPDGSHHTNAPRILGIKLRGLEKLPPRMGPAPKVQQPASANVCVSRVPVALKSSCKPLQKRRRSAARAPHLEIVHNHAARRAVLPQVSLMIATPRALALHGNGGFIGLDITTCEQLRLHRAHHPHEQLTGSEHRTAQRALADFNAHVASQADRLVKKRKVVNILVDNGLNNEAVCKHSFFNNRCRRRRSTHSGFLATGTRTFFALDDLHEHFDGFDGEAFAAFVADELFVLTALDAGALVLVQRKKPDGSVRLSHSTLNKSAKH
jgi:hypothetical protein